MCLEQFDARCGAHLARYYAFEISLNGQFVDGAYLVGVDNESQRAEEGLCLLALPMKVDAYCDVVKRERCVGRLWVEGEFAVLHSVPEDSAFVEFYSLFALDKVALCHVRLVERERNLGSANNTDRY